MEVKVRSIGNAMGFILPKSISTMMDFHPGDVVTVEIHDAVMSIHKQKDDLKKRILRGIKASEKENLDFANSFSELDSE